MSELILSRDMAENKALFDLQLHCWRNRTRIAVTARDGLGRFTNKGNHA